MLSGRGLRRRVRGGAVECCPEFFECLVGEEGVSAELRVGAEDFVANVGWVVVEACKRGGVEGDENSGVNGSQRFAVEFLVLNEV